MPELVRLERHVAVGHALLRLARGERERRAEERR